MQQNVSPPRTSLALAFRRSRWRAGVAFWLIVVFMVAQVSWWLIFQRDYLEKATLATIAAWQHQASLAQQVLEVAPPASLAGLRGRLAAEHPYLDFSQTPVRLQAGVLEEYQRQQKSYLRMFAYEAPFFVLVILLGIWLIAQSRRSDQELKRRQQNFLMAATHEFRTPISTMRLVLETIQYRELSREKQQEYLRRLELELKRLQDASERVLATARLEQGFMTRKAVHDLNTVVTEIVAEQRGALEAQGARLSVESSGAPLPVDVDPAAFGIVLSNLLDNAVKYSPDGEKPVIVRLGQQLNEAFVSVEDRGSGIDPKEIPHIFDQFYRVGNELTRAARGLGLGLFLAQSITELMGGKVSCQPLEKGTRFTVSLPLEAASAPFAEQSRRPA